MTKSYFFIGILMFSMTSVAQTNTFPNSGNVGIGTNTPIYKLEVNGEHSLLRLVTSNSSAPYPAIDMYNSVSGTEFVLSPSADKVDMFTYSNHPLALGTGAAEKMRISTIGNVGIGTTNPMQKFVVSDNGAEGFEIYLGQPTGLVGLQSFNRATSSHSKMQFDASNFNFGIGNVGIGTTDTKGYKLAVAGNMIAESVKVQLQGSWSDFVFADDYKLPTLQETAKHIKEKGHLQGIPSAAEVKANGIDLGEMNAKLLQKIEELTLHLIEMKKESETQQKVSDDRYKMLQAEIEKLKH